MPGKANANISPFFAFPRAWLLMCKVGPYMKFTDLTNMRSDISGTKMGCKRVKPSVSFCHTPFSLYRA